MTSEHAELIGEMASLEKMQMGERLKHAKKRRAQQLKAYTQYEKQLGKEVGKRSKKNKAVKPEEDRVKTKGRIKFEASILLLDAASRNDQEEVNNLLNSGVSPDVCNEDGLTALHQCCIDDLEEIVKLLVQFNANINARDSEMWTPLHAAATCGHVKLCKYLCEHGADLLAVNADGNMPYDLCEGKTLDYIESDMAKAGVTQELIDDTRLSSENTMLNDLKSLVSAGGDLEYVGRNGETPLHIAACNGFVHVTEFLLDHHVRLDVKDNEDWQPIHCAACWGQLPVLEILIEHGSDFEAKTRNGETPLDLCDDNDTRNRMQEMIDEIENKMPMKRDIAHEEERRRNSVARRGSTVTAHGMRRGSIHDKSAISHREAAEEAQRLRESMASMASLREDDDEDKPNSPNYFLSPPFEQTSQNKIVHESEKDSPIPSPIASLSPHSQLTSPYSPTTFSISPPSSPSPISSPTTPFSLPTSPNPLTTPTGITPATIDVTLVPFNPSPGVSANNEDKNIGLAGSGKAGPPSRPPAPVLNGQKPGAANNDVLAPSMIEVRSNGSKPNPSATVSAPASNNRSSVFSPPTGSLSEMKRARREASSYGYPIATVGNGLHSDASNSEPIKGNGNLTTASYSNENVSLPTTNESTNHMNSTKRRFSNPHEVVEGDSDFHDKECCIIL